MATSLLGIDALFAAIPGSEPGGPNPKTIRDKDPLRDPTQLDRSRREAVEKGHSLPVDDPSRLKQWRDLMKLAQDLFTTRSKNLGWAIAVVDAAVRVHGFAGAREGFQFLTRLTNEGWEWMWPRVDPKDAEGENDPEERAHRLKELATDALDGRAGRFQSLDDSGSGLLFPNALREWTIAEVDGVTIAVNTCRGADGRSAKVSSDDLQSAARKLGSEKVRDAMAEIESAILELELLRAAAESRFTAAGAADQAPSFREVRTALEECRQIADQMLAAVEGEADDAESAPVRVAGEPEPAAGEAKGKMTRESLYKQIAQITDHLARLEPHSPVPFLLRRVVELQELPFPELVRQFTQTSETVLGFLERSLNEKPPTGD